MKSKMTVEMAKGLADLQRQILTVVHNYVNQEENFCTALVQLIGKKMRITRHGLWKTFRNLKKSGKNRCCREAIWGMDSILLNLENNRLEQGHGEKRHRIL